jgi:hypothetical protein
MKAVCLRFATAPLVATVTSGDSDPWLDWVLDKVDAPIPACVVGAQEHLPDFACMSDGLPATSAKARDLLGTDFFRVFSPELLLDGHPHRRIGISWDLELLRNEQRGIISPTRLTPGSSLEDGRIYGSPHIQLPASYLVSEATWARIQELGLTGFRTTGLVEFDEAGVIISVTGIPEPKAREAFARIKRATKPAATALFEAFVEQLGEPGAPGYPARGLPRLFYCNSLFEADYNREGCAQALYVHGAVLPEVIEVYRLIERQDLVDFVSACQKAYLVVLEQFGLKVGEGLEEDSLEALEDAVEPIEKRMNKSKTVKNTAVPRLAYMLERREQFLAEL